jgi:hypothetical protein
LDGDDPAGETRRAEELDHGRANTVGIDHDRSVAEPRVTKHVGDPVDEALEGRAEMDALDMAEPDVEIAYVVVGDGIAAAGDFFGVLEDGDRRVIATLSDVYADDPFGGGE